MDRNKLLALIESWREGTCPNEILLDAMMDYGIDVDKPADVLQMKSIRHHMISCNGRQVVKERRPEVRGQCSAIESLVNQLKEGYL